ncbi:MAG TPA: 16S rRNA (uracil(1498)-N(3))-methyltransferase [Candidatus Omnitrophica bacterium]|nr:MAG: 16S rRNA (uracil(1498)-N(3))-methyltransferase [Omnitrophica WOR_2 bacterium GWA2_53_43]HBO97530.1 16S rRNA (uracil(1498)-N(3))-methyltransferase [Candidatus Omnitrophota bacterium]HCI45362.1 16S rRNA (uracil(1498)-N(3))-methyltransferase [Candidatus Omnitrophota bacterium]
MNLILLSPDDFINKKTRVRLDDRRYLHIRDIHRAKAGDELSVGLIGDRIGTGKIASLTGEAIEMDISLSLQPPAPIPVTLILALPRPNILKRTLQAASAMGVKKIFLIHSNQVEKSFWLSPVLQPAKIREQLILGLEQGKDTILPDVQLRKGFKPFVEDELPDLIQGTRALVAHPRASEECPRDVREPVTLMIGPEGGFIPYEIKKLTELGFTPVHLGNRILRVENAIVALLAKLY